MPLGNSQQSRASIPYVVRRIRDQQASPILTLLPQVVDHICGALSTPEHPAYPRVLVRTIWIVRLRRRSSPVGCYDESDEKYKGRETAPFGRSGVVGGPSCTTAGPRAGRYDRRAA